MRLGETRARAGGVAIITQQNRAGCALDFTVLVFFEPFEPVPLLNKSDGEQDETACGPFGSARACLPGRSSSSHVCMWDGGRVYVDLRLRQEGYVPSGRD